MGVGDEDGLDRLAFDRREDRREMAFVAGARIEDRDRALPENVGAGAVEGERRGVRGDEAAHERREPGDLARRRLPRVGEQVGFVLVSHALRSSGPRAT